MTESAKRAQGEDGPTCPVHPETRLICPRCIAAKGGASRAQKHESTKISEWGKLGGRGNKRPTK